MIFFVPFISHIKMWRTEESQKTLGWQPEVKFDDGIKKTIRWYVDHIDWWENLINEDIHS